MKKTNVVSIMMIFILLVNICSVSAKTGDVNGSALHTDIVAYINHYAISSYAINVINMSLIVHNWQKIDKNYFKFSLRNLQKYLEKFVCLMYNITMWEFTLVKNP